MATELSSGPVNGFSAGPPSSSPTPGQTQEPEVSKEQIGWYFVERYYNTLSKNPANLYLLYSKRSQFVVGVEEEKVQVCIGLKAINDRVKELNYQNCKVRVNNVDSQSSDVNIVVQVLGEMSNDSQPHRKFVQTFVLAPQPQGYFLLNDILRFLIEEDESNFDASGDTQAAPEEAVPTVVEDKAEAEPELAPAEDVVATPDAAVGVDQKLEEVAKAEEAEPVNGTTPEAEKEEETEVVAAEPSVAGAEDAEAKSEESAVDELVMEEKPIEPAAPTPAEPQTAPKPAPVQNKPALPLSWAQRAAASAAAAAAPAATTTPAQPKATPITASTSTTSSSAQAAPAVAPVSVPARQPSPTDSNQDGSTGGWQTAGGDHSRNKSRSQPGPNLTENGHVRAYVKNVYQTVNADELKAELSKYGELAYFDISRPKNSAFVEFKTLSGFQSAVQNNPHKIGGDNIYVEERRPATFNPRGGMRDGMRSSIRGGGRSGSYAPGKTEGGSRGGFTGNRGRGGTPGMTANRGRAQQV